MKWAVAVRILVVSIIVGGLAYLGARLLPKTYNSYTSIYFPAMQASKGGLSALAQVSGAGEGEGGAITSLRGALVSPLVGSAPATATGILLSRTCLLDVVKKLNLDERWKCSESLAAATLQQKVSVKTEKSGFLRVDATTEDPELSMHVVDAMFDHLKSRSTALSLNVSKRNRTFIQQRLIESDRKVEQARAKLISKLSQDPASQLPEVRRAYVDTRLKLEEALVKVASARSELEALRNALKSTSKTTKSFAGDLSAMQALGTNADSASIGLSLDVLATQLQQRRLELVDAGKKFTRSSDEYQEAAKREATVRQLVDEILKSESQRLAAGESPKLVKAQVQLQALEASVEGYQRALAGYERVALTTPESSTATEANRAQFAAALSARAMLQSELEMAIIAEMRDPSRFEVVDPPMVDPEPVGPRKGLIAGIAFVIALLAQLVPAVARGSQQA